MSDEPDIEFDVHQDSVSAAMGAAVAHVLDRPDSIRQRAQTAATIATAVVAALVVAAIAGLSRDQTESFGSLTKVLVAAATVVWIVTVVLFVLVVVFARREPARQPYPGFVTEFQKYADVLRRRLRRAAWSSTLALVLAVAAIGAEVYELQTSADRERLLVLTPEATSAVGRLCGHALKGREVRRGHWTIHGRVGTTALARPLVAVSVRAIVDARRDERTLSCDGDSMPVKRDDDGLVVVRLPKGAVVASTELQDDG